MDLFDTPSPHPTVHVFGKADEFYDYGRDGFGYKPQEDAEKERATKDLFLWVHW